jgi:hypothetical protein
MNLGPCPDCGEALGSDQRYCANCGHRVQTPLAPTYMPVAAPEPVAARSGGWPFPIPISMASTFAALALGLGVVMGTAISPNLSGLVAGGHLSDELQVAQQPGPSEPAPAPGNGGKGGRGGEDKSGGFDAGSDFGTGSGPGFYGSSGSTPSYGGVSPDSGGKKKKEKKPAEKPIYLAGTVVHKNPVAGSYSISSGGGLSAIHAKGSAGLPAPGTRVKVPIRQLANRTYAEDGKRQKKGQATQATFTGVVTDSRDSSVASTPDVYTVSGRGASVLVHAEDPGMIATPPPVGQFATTTVAIRNAAATPEPPSLAPPYGCPFPSPAFPNPAIVPQKELFQTAPPIPSVAVTATEIATVVQGTCPGATSTVLLSSDDVREGAADVVVTAAAGIDLARLVPGQAVIASVTIGGGALIEITGSASDYGIKGADDKASGQGNLARVSRASQRRIARAAKRSRR